MLELEVSLLFEKLAIRNRRYLGQAPVDMELIRSVLYELIHNRIAIHVVLMTLIELCVQDHQRVVKEGKISFRLDGWGIFVK